MSRRVSVIFSRNSAIARFWARTSSARFSISAARATSGMRSKPKASSIVPPCPLLAKRLPFGESRRMISPASTRQARCRRSVAGAMPWARIESSLFEGKTTMPGPDESVSPALESHAGKVSAVS